MGGGPSLTTTSRRSPPSILCSDSEEACRSLSRPSLERPSPSRLSPLTALRMLKPRSRTRRESPQTSRGSSLLESSSRMGGHSLTTTSRRSPPSILCSDSEEETNFVAQLRLSNFCSVWICFCTYKIQNLNN